MKYITFGFNYIFLLALTVIAVSCTGKVHSDLDEQNLNSNINEVYIEEYEVIKEGERILKGRRTDARKITFNKDGNIIEDIDFNKNLEVSQKIINSYNSDGKKLQSDVINEGKLLANWVYSHKSSSRQSNVKVYNKEGILFKEDELFFAESGRLIEEKNFKEGGHLVFHRKYFYNKEGDLNKQTVIANGEVINKEEYLYKKMQIEKYVYNRHGNLIRKEIQIVDENNNPIEIKKFGEALFSDSEEFSLLNSAKYEYSYDEQKNWIKRIHYNKHAEATSIIERRISYY